MELNFVLTAVIILPLATSLLRGGSAQERTVDSVLQMYANRVGGQAAINRIVTRQTEAKRHKGAKLTYYWQKPDKALRVSHGDKAGFDGSTGWLLSRKKLIRLTRDEREELETDANPLRYVHLHDLYMTVELGPSERLDERPMDVLIAPNNIGSTKFYFDAASHLLVQIEETGVTSAYYKHITQFADYKEVDGIKLPFRIVHISTEPGAKAEDIRITNVEQNVEIAADLFNKPNVGTIVAGKKR